ncbi:Putative invertase inhibitor [Linum grandiflorum]
MKMNNISTLLLFIALFLHQAAAVPTPLLDNTCKSTTNYALCVSSLESDPRTATAVDVRGLATIELDIILAKANVTLDHVGKLFSGVTDPYLYRAYGTCIEEFRGAVEGADSSLAGSISGLKSGDYVAAKSGLQLTKDHVAMCLEGFAGSKQPFTDEAQLVDGLSSVGISIIGLLH